MNELGRRKSMIGVVISNKMDKTAVVAVERRRPHPLYRKIVRSTKHYKAHDPNNAAKLGDVVRIVETRPLSKEKRWRIASRAISSPTPATSKSMRPGRTTATQRSTGPLPLPMRTSAGFFVTGLSGKMRIQTLPPRRRWWVIARRAASI